MKPTQGRTYTTIQGDTFESIAAQAYGDPEQANLIIDVNPLQIVVANDDQLPTGTELIIPVDADVDDLRQAQFKNGLRNIK